MKKSRKLIVLILALSLGPIIADAQILKKLKRAAKEGVENAVERRVEKEIENAAQRQTDKYLEQVFGPPSSYEGGEYDYGKIMSSANLNVDTEESYRFKGYSDMEVTGTDEKGKKMDPVAFRSFLSDDSDFWAIKMDSDEKEVKETVMIFDNKNQATVLLMESDKGEKSSIAYGIDWNKMMESTAEDEMEEAEKEDFSIKKTGNTKTILGYPCEEYLTEHEDYTARFWVSSSPIEGYTSYWSKDNFLFSKNRKLKHKNYFDQLPEGDVLEMNYQSKVDDSSSIMKILEINTSEQFNFEMSAYPNAMKGQE